MKKIILLLIAAIAAFALAGCTHGGATSGQAIEGQDSSNIEKTYLLNQPPPHFPHSDIRATAISIEAIQALGEQTTSFFFNLGQRNPIFSCPSLGEPVASTTQITNPQQLIPDTHPGYNNSTSLTIGNMDPNGIYAGDSTGTYVLCVNASGTPYAQYWEGFVDSVSGPARWDSASGQIVVTGQPTMPTCKITTAGKKPATTCTK